MPPSLHRARLLATFALGAVLFNYPVLSLFNRGRLALQAGRTDEGRGLLEEFLRRWGSADLPEVAQARELLAH